MLTNNNLNILHNALLKILTPLQIITNAEQTATFLSDKRNSFNSSCALVVLPNNTKEVSEIVKLCSNLQISIVPESGNTGLVGGSVSTNAQVILSLQNLNQIREIDAVNQTICLEAGVTLAEAISAANKHNLLFPLDLPSRETCRIGGNMATNAGGLNTLKYGSVKNFTLGIEVVLSNGTIISDLNKLSKRNIGADYKGLFIGSEGILGVITAGSFKLYPKPITQSHILFATNSVEQVIESYAMLKSIFSFQISAFELMNNLSVQISTTQYKNSMFPLSKNHPWYGLISLDFYTPNANSAALINNAFASLKQQNLILDHVIEEETNNIWQFRNLMSDAQKKHGLSLKHDIAVPLSNMAKFIAGATEAVNKITPLAKPVIFGHIGDQSLHFNFTSSNPTDDSNNLLANKLLIKEQVVELAMQNHGSFSAEHGIGLLHINELEKYYFHNQFYMLKLLKNMLDPTNIFNPQKVIKVINNNESSIV